MKLKLLLTAVLITLGLPATADAVDRASYECGYVSLVFPYPSFSAFARDCVGPEGAHRNITFTNSRPPQAGYCTTGNAFRISDGTLMVSGQYCL